MEPKILLMVSVMHNTLQFYIHHWSRPFLPHTPFMMSFLLKTSSDPVTFGCWLFPFSVPLYSTKEKPFWIFPIFGWLHSPPLVLAQGFQSGSLCSCSGLLSLILLATRPNLPFVGPLVRFSHFLIAISISQLGCETTSSNPTSPRVDLHQADSRVKVAHFFSC